MLGLHFLLHGSNVLTSRGLSKHVLGMEFQSHIKFQFASYLDDDFLGQLLVLPGVFECLFLVLGRSNAPLPLSLIFHAYFLLYVLTRIHFILLENILPRAHLCSVLKQIKCPLTILGLIFFIFQLSTIIFGSCVFYLHFPLSFCQHVPSEENHGK